MTRASADAGGADLVHAGIRELTENIAKARGAILLSTMAPTMEHAVPRLPPHRIARGIREA